MFQDKDSTVLGCMGLILYAIVLVAVGVLVKGFVLQYLWRWFMVPVFELPALTILQAYGIVLVLNFISPRKTETKDTKDKSLTVTLISGMVEVVVSPAIWLLIGYIVTLFM